MGEDTTNSGRGQFPVIRLNGRPPVDPPSWTDAPDEDDEAPEPTT